jgi:hypothetical protein
MIVTSIAKRVLPLALVALMSVVGVSNVSAQQEGNIPVDVVVGSAPGAGLSWTAAETSAFPDVPYSFEAQRVTGTMAVTVTDSRGTEAGWVATIASSDFVGAATGRTIPIGNLSLAAGPVQVITGQAAPLPVANSIVMSESPRTVFSAAPGSGSGRYGVSYTATLLIPGNTQVDTYATTLHVSLTAAP